MNKQELKTAMGMLDGRADHMRPMAVVHKGDDVQQCLAVTFGGGHQRVFYALDDVKKWVADHPAG